MSSQAQRVAKVIQDYTKPGSFPDPEVLRVLKIQHDFANTIDDDSIKKATNLLQQHKR